MAITSIGSSFSWIAPSAAVRGSSAAAAEATEASATRGAGHATAEEASESQVSGGSKPAVSDAIHAQLVKEQESHTARATPAEAARAYAGHG